MGGEESPWQCFHLRPLPQVQGSLRPRRASRDGVGVHDLGWRSVCREQFGHRPHRFLYVMEEELEGRAEVVQARLAVGGAGEAVLRAASVAGEANVAFAAVARERVALVQAELPLLLGGDQIDEVPVGDVAQQVAGLDEVIARVDVTGVLEREREPAGLAVHAQARGLPDPVRQRRVEHLHVHARDIVADPFLEDVDQEPSVPVRA